MRERFTFRSAWGLGLAVGLALRATAGQPNPSWATETDALDAALARVAAVTDAAGAAERDAAIEAHWRLQQDHMRRLRHALVADGSACAQWMLMDPGPVGRSGGSDEAGSARVGDCPMMSHGWQAASARGWDPPVLDAGTYLRAWTPPANLAGPDCAALDGADGARRRALLLECYEAGYRQMQTARGRAWMWAPGTVDDLPAPDSPGARLALRYCAQCHAVPPPALQDARAWKSVVGRMRVHAGDAGRGGDPAFETPTAAEFDAIEAWLVAYGAGRE